MADAENPFSINGSADPTTSSLLIQQGPTSLTLLLQTALIDIGSRFSRSSVEEGQLPLAEAGVDLTLEEGTTATLDGSQSADPLGRTLAYTWSVVSRPSDSIVLGVDTPNAMTTTFTPDVGGRYLISLIVNNGVSDSLPDTVTVDVYSSNPLAPIADAGEDMLDEFDCTAFS